MFSLRRQAELCKIARANGVEELLPPSRKSTAYKEERLAKREEVGAAAGGRWRRMLEPRGKAWERGLHGRYVVLVVVVVVVLVFVMLRFEVWPGEVGLERDWLTCVCAGQVGEAEEGDGGYACTYREVEEERARKGLEGMATVNSWLGGWIWGGLRWIAGWWGG